MAQIAAFVATIMLPLALSYGKLDHFGDGLIQNIFNRYDNMNQDVGEVDYEVRPGSLRRV